MDLAQLEVKNIQKTFQRSGVQACRDVSFTLRRGEVLGIIGENGAGKSTLVHIVTGQLQADSGSIRRRDGSSIAIVRQHPLLLDDCSVAENIFVGREPKRFGFIRKKELIGRIEELSARYGIRLPPNKKAGELSLSGRMFTSLLSALYTSPSVLILDEPTAVCSDQESEIVFRIIEDLREAGSSIIFISHKLDDILRVCGRILIMRNGSIIAEKKQADCTSEELSRLMFHDHAGAGQQSAFDPRTTDAVETGGTARLGPAGAAGPSLQADAFSALPQTPGTEAVPPAPTGAAASRAGAPAHPGPAEAAEQPQKPVFTLRGIDVSGPGGRGLHGLSLSVSAGEVVGVTGLKESGLDILEDLLCGLRRPSAGCYTFLGNECSASELSSARRKGLRIVPSDRNKRGSAPDARVWENLIITERRRFQKHLLLDRSRIGRHTQQLLARNNIAADADNTAEELSGGSLQKLIIYRELDGRVPFACIAEPSNGLDTRSRELLHRRIFRLAEEGSGILIISSDTDEILKICTHIAVLYRGRIISEKAARDFSPAGLGNAIIGIGEAEGRRRERSSGQTKGRKNAAERKGESQC
jgi:ABC-type uncharacterized transport system ATPase subunit